ncbi:MAG TPA: DUF222 domain-containing protein [Actinomycetota bacterium]|nr:DUF222 domain-containing protein [Actinomycetota bacterium]
MSELRSALDGLRAEDVSALSEAALATDLDELERAGRIIEAERGRRLVEFERRKSYAVDGHLSAATWLADRQTISAAAAEATVRTARSLQQMPTTAEALGQGDISTSAVRMLAAAQEAAPIAFKQSEAALVEVARAAPFGELRRVLAHWRMAADPDGAIQEEDRRFERRSLNVSPAADGMVAVAGELDPETGQSLISALRAVADHEARTGDPKDMRTPTQRRADALGELCRQWLDSLDRPTVGGERPHVVVTMDVRTLEARAGHGAELDDTGAVTSEAARRIACDANVTRVITDAASEPLEVGRRTKTVPTALRRAVAVRDRCCRFPGCERPPGWCDAHHVRHWADGGETSLQNLILLCRPHHRAIHRGFRVEMVDGRPIFRRPDGTPLPERAPP